MMKLSVILCVALLGLAHSRPAQAFQSGPQFDPLQVTYSYTRTGNLYFRFNAGSMPGCYADNSGYLKKANSMFDQLYAQVLTLIAMGGMKGRVVYEIVNPGGGTWGDCDIIGFELKPIG